MAIPKPVLECRPSPGHVELRLAQARQTHLRTTRDFRARIHKKRQSYTGRDQVIGNTVESHQEKSLQVELG